MTRKLFPTMALIMILSACGASANDTGAKQNNNNQPDTSMKTAKTDSTDAKVEVETSAGTFTILLYGDTPSHRDNFLKLAKEGYYDGTLFHRVIDEFMVQAGDPDSKNAPAGKMLGSGGPGYQIDAEIVYPGHFHKRGALAAARQGDQVNPLKKSSGSQFYVVTGKKMSDSELSQMEQHIAGSKMQQYFNSLAQQRMAQIRQMQQQGDQAGLQALQKELVAQTEAYAAAHPFSMPQEMKDIYKSEGGTPFLDNEYTVFGEVISGMDVIGIIEKAKTDSNDRPVEDIKIISMKIIE